MSERVIIHHSSRAWSCDGRSDRNDLNRTNTLWRNVTCEVCKQEQPKAEEDEDDMTETGALLAEVERLGLKPEGPSLAELKYMVRTAQLLEQAQVCREHAAQTLLHWQQELSKAMELEKQLQGTLRASLAGEQPVDEAEEERRFPIWETQGITEQEWERGQEQSRRLLGNRIKALRSADRGLGLREARDAVVADAYAEALSAPLAAEPPASVVAVGAEALGAAQTNVAGLSSQAQSALIEAEVGYVVAGAEVYKELRAETLVELGRLTPKGEAARALLVNRKLDEAFGPLA